MPAALEPAQAERDRGERQLEQLRERGRRQRPVRSDRDVERVVVRRKVGALERGLDQTLALLLRPEDFEEDRRWAGGGHESSASSFYICYKIVVHASPASLGDRRRGHRH